MFFSLGWALFYPGLCKDAKEGQIEADEVKYNIKINSVHISRNPFATTNGKDPETIESANRNYQRV